MKSQSTNNQAINEILSTLGEKLSSLLNENLVGFYLTGSLTYGDFDLGSSDIDFLVVLKQSLSKQKLADIEALHAVIGSRFPEWSKRIEGSYITEEMLVSIQPPEDPRPYFNANKMWSFRFGYEWLVNLYTLRESGIALIGPDPIAIVPQFTLEDVREASRKNFRTEWQPILDSKAPFKSPDYDKSHLQAYAILSMCRIMFTAQNSGIVSKKRAAGWAKTTYPDWKWLIERAEQWKHGQKLDLVEETLEFIRFAGGEIEKSSLAV